VKFLHRRIGVASYLQYLNQLCGGHLAILAAIRVANRSGLRLSHVIQLSMMLEPLILEQKTVVVIDPSVTGREPRYLTRTRQTSGLDWRLVASMIGHFQQYLLCSQGMLITTLAVATYQVCDSDSLLPQRGILASFFHTRKRRERLG
jgi:hypothetical protein